MSTYSGKQAQIKTLAIIICSLALGALLALRFQKPVVIEKTVEVEKPVTVQVADQEMKDRIEALTKEVNSLR